MLWSTEDLRGYSIRATDDTLGSVNDFLFDDQSWTVRYLVVDTSRWLFGRRVLIPPTALGHPDRDAREFPVSLTTEQVKESPGIDTDKPVSRQYETQLHAYYGWAPYWGAPGMMAGVPPTYAGTRTAAMTQPPGAEGRPDQRGDPHLRSAYNVVQYYIHATDGDIGHAYDFLLDEDGWVIRYLVVDTRNWLPGKKVLVSPRWVQAIDWASGQISICLDRKSIENGPEYDPDRPLERGDEEQLHRHYEQPPYW